MCALFERDGLVRIEQGGGDERVGAALDKAASAWRDREARGSGHASRAKGDEPRAVPLRCEVQAGAKRGVGGEVGACGGEPVEPSEVPPREERVEPGRREASGEPDVLPGDVFVAKHVGVDGDEVEGYEDGAESEEDRPRLLHTLPLPQLDAEDQEEEGVEAEEGALRPAAAAGVAHEDQRGNGEQERSQVKHKVGLAAGGPVAKIERDMARGLRRGSRPRRPERRRSWRDRGSRYIRNRHDRSVGGRYSDCQGRHRLGFGCPPSRRPDGEEALFVHAPHLGEGRFRDGAIPAEVVDFREQERVDRDQVPRELFGPAAAAFGAGRRAAIEDFTAAPAVAGCPEPVGHARSPGGAEPRRS
ncbi:MAG: hypothetical protein IPI85_17485 [Dehalococcoidia bacterium]|nr:hypothetical protein [Dehalococcoidia bacterium]